jgi:protein-S-isoprenylcysteine O-methyltransferase Ste14
MLYILRLVATNLLLSVLVIAVYSLAFMADRFWPLTLPGQLELLAWPLYILGILLILAAEYSFLSVSRATGAPGNPPQKLVTTGLYRWVRNPIYLGVASLLFGVAFFRSSPTMLLIAFAFLPAIHAFVVLVEEPRTERRLGADYARYKQNVPRWLPRPPRREKDTLERIDQPM